MKSKVKVLAPSLYYLSRIHKLEMPVTKQDSIVQAEMVFDTYGDAIQHLTLVSEAYCRDTEESSEQFIDNLEVFGYAKLDNMIVSVEDVVTGEFNTMDFTEFLLDHDCSVHDMNVAIELVNQYLKSKQQ